MNDPEKKRCIQEQLDRLRDERASRLEAAAANRDALRSQFSRIRETVEWVLNDDTSLAERLRTLFREQGVTITSILTALGFIVSTIVLAIQNAVGVTPTPTPPTPSSGGTDWVKKTAQDPRRLAESAGWKGGCGAAWSYWCYCLVATQYRGLRCGLACWKLVGFSRRAGRCSRNDSGLLPQEIVENTSADCRDRE